MKVFLSQSKPRVITSNSFKYNGDYRVRYFLTTRQHARESATYESYRAFFTGRLDERSSTTTVEVLGRRVEELLKVSSYLPCIQRRSHLNERSRYS